MTGILISRDKFQSTYKVIGTEGKFNLRVAGNPVKYINPNLASSSENYSHSYLVNLKAVEQRNVQRVLEAYGDEDAIDLAELNGLNKVIEIIVNANAETGEITEPDLPAKGEDVIVTFEFATRDGEFVKDVNDKKILNYTSMRVAPAQQAQRFTFSSVPLMEDDAKEEQATKTSKKKDEVPA